MRSLAPRLRQAGERGVAIEKPLQVIEPLLDGGRDLVHAMPLILAIANDARGMEQRFGAASPALTPAAPAAADADRPDTPAAGTSAADSSSAPPSPRPLRVELRIV